MTKYFNSSFHVFYLWKSLKESLKSTINRKDKLTKKFFHQFTDKVNKRFWIKVPFCIEVWPYKGKNCFTRKERQLQTKKQKNLKVVEQRTNSNVIFVKLQRLQIIKRY